MADNFLEQRMEDLRNGRLAAGLRPVKRKAHARPDVCAVVIGGAGPTGLDIVRRLRRKGVKVDIIDRDRKRGPMAAQATGSRFVPLDVTDTDSLRSTMEEIVNFRGNLRLIVNSTRENIPKSAVSQVKPHVIHSHDDGFEEDFSRILETL